MFGTVLNRFVIEAVLGHPPTVYGTGGQTRGFLDIRDTVRCVEPACLNPADRGEFRVFNQMTESFSVQSLAELVRQTCTGEVRIDYLDNPRVEKEEHHYNVVHTALVDLGLQPHLPSDTLISSMFDIAKRYADRVQTAALTPKVDWRATESPAQEV